MFYNLRSKSKVMIFTVCQIQDPLVAQRSVWLSRSLVSKEWAIK